MSTEDNSARRNTYTWFRFYFLIVGLSTMEINIIIKLTIAYCPTSGYARNYTKILVLLGALKASSLMCRIGDSGGG